MGPQFTPDRVITPVTLQHMEDRLDTDTMVGMLVDMQYMLPRSILHHRQAIPVVTKDPMEPPTVIPVASLVLELVQGHTLVCLREVPLEVLIMVDLPNSRPVIQVDMLGMVSPSKSQSPNTSIITRRPVQSLSKSPSLCQSIDHIPCTLRNRCL